MCTDEREAMTSKTFKVGTRVYHTRLKEFGVVIPAPEDHDTTTVKFDDGESLRVSTTSLVTGMKEH